MATRELIRTINERKGNIVIGSNFVGREDLIYDMMDYFYCSKTGKNMTINGLPRIGKTSLVRHSATMSKQTPEFDPHIIVVYADLNGECRRESIDNIYKWIVIRIIDELRKVQKEHTILSEADFNELLSFEHKVNDEQNEIHRLQHFLEALKEKQIGIRLILDEFDSILKICSHDGKLDVNMLNGFYACLRVFITDNENYGIKVVLISRNKLSEMEPPGVESKLSGVCESITLTPFDKKEKKEYWDQLCQFDNEGSTLTPEYMEHIEQFSGNVPYWLDVVNFTFLNGLQKKMDAEDLEEHLYRTMRNEFDSVLKMLGDSCCPRYNLSQSDVSLLAGYAIITKHKDNTGEVSYTSLSTVFEEYLHFVPLDIPIWESIFLLETKMRMLIKERYLSEYSGDWEQDYMTKYGNSNSGFIPKLRRDREKSIKLFGDGASLHLVDYMYMRDYYTYFIKDNWAWFSRVFKRFGGDMVLFQSRMSFLCDVRNPLAHSNGNFLTKDETVKADDYCKFLIEQIDEYMY